MKLQYFLNINLQLDIGGERNAIIADKELIKKKNVSSKQTLINAFTGA